MVFIDEVKKCLLSIGAVADISDGMQFDLQTAENGVLWIRIDEDQTYCYTVFARFVDPSLCPIHLHGVNLFSGKWNQHLSSEGNPKLKAEIIIDTLKRGVKPVIFN